MTDPNDMEDPQVGEVLPPMLLEAYWTDVMAITSEERDCDVVDADRYIKHGVELCFKTLLPHMQAALPYYEAGVKDTRIGQADAGKLAELAVYKELVEYEQ